jgi:hypothetical protein
MIWMIWMPFWKRHTKIRYSNQTSKLVLPKGYRSISCWSSALIKCAFAAHITSCPKSSNKVVLVMRTMNSFIPFDLFTLMRCRHFEIRKCNNQIVIFLKIR